MTGIQALEVALIGWLVSGIEVWFAYPMANTPLVLCPLVGFLCGDLTTGVLCGAVLQLIFLGVIGLGGTLPADAAAGSLVGTAFSIGMGQGVEAALIFALPVSMAGTVFSFLAHWLRIQCVPLSAQLVKDGNQRGLEWLHRSLALLPNLPKYLAVFFVLALGGGAAEQLVHSLPEAVFDGLSQACRMMPAVGIAMLMKMLRRKNLIVYFFIGFLLASILGRSPFSVALIGAAAAGIIVMQENKNTTAVKTEAEDLFDD